MPVAVGSGSVQPVTISVRSRKGHENPGNTIVPAAAPWDVGEGVGSYPPHRAASDRGPVTIRNPSRSAQARGRGRRQRIAPSCQRPGDGPLAAAAATRRRARRCRHPRPTRRAGRRPRSCLHTCAPPPAASFMLASFLPPLLPAPSHGEPLAEGRVSRMRTDSRDDEPENSDCMIFDAAGDTIKDRGRNHRHSIFRRAPPAARRLPRRGWWRRQASGGRP